MEEHLEPDEASDVETVGPIQQGPAHYNKRRSACLVMIMGALLCLVCMIGGAILFSYYAGKTWWPGSSSSSSQAFMLDKKRICEMAFVQQTMLVDTRSEFTWDVDVPLTVDTKLEIGRADVKVKGVYLIKYGIEQNSIGLWHYYPDTRDLQIGMPKFKVLSVETLFQELDAENESLLKKLQMSERNQAFKRNRDDAMARANAAIETTPELHQECMKQLEGLLASFGINLVIVGPLPGLD